MTTDNPASEQLTEAHERLKQQLIGSLTKADLERLRDAALKRQARAIKRMRAKL